LVSACGFAGEANIVRVMSVHRSKGLEFPVVFLADTARQFNLADLREAALLHPSYGFACQRRERGSMRQFPTIPMNAIRLQSAKSQLEEEMRCLYVALTRAREKLVITCAHRRGTVGKRLADLAQPISDGKLPPFLAASAKCPADWLMMSLLHHPDGEALREAANCRDLDLCDRGDSWNISTVNPDALQGEFAPVSESQAMLLPDEALIRELERRMSYQYPDEAQTLVPTKLAVSEAVKSMRSADYRFTARPRFLAGHSGALTPAERGQALHKFMQFASYENARDNLQSEIRRMETQEFLSKAEAGSLSQAKLRAFFGSELASRIFNSEHVMRELRFMSEFGQDKLCAVLPRMNENSRVVVQGVADCVLIEPDGAVIIDYKTDRVKDIHELAERYRAQLELYRGILSESLNMPVKSCVIYSFELSDAIEL